MFSTPAISRAGSSRAPGSAWQTRAVCCRRIFSYSVAPNGQIASQTIGATFHSTIPRPLRRRPSTNFQKQAYRYKHENVDGKCYAYLGLGSNMGDRIAMIEQACREMEAGGRIKVLRTSNLWETSAMYVLDQPNFINGVCKIETTLGPLQLLDELQAVENRMGRVKVIDKGPRNIDLDILMYEDFKFTHPRLQLPHALMLEREFVLRPLLQLFEQDIRPDKSYWTMWKNALRKLPKPAESLTTITTLGPRAPAIHALEKTRKTHIMSILNVTPDSFSDGGQNFDLDTETLTNTIKAHIAAGATIIDVGGQSTRPGAVLISAELELGRVLPVIQLIRSLPEAEKVAISVDTFYASVAEASVAAGADIINDVSAGLMDREMLPTVARLGCTICLMHMRGDPATMANLTEYPNGLLTDVSNELSARVRAAEAAGIRRWRIILDPGIGFSKTTEQNLQLLRLMSALRASPDLYGCPWLVGTSRKAFIGKITGVKEPKDRLLGTAVAVSHAISGGADIVRVHDVPEMAQVAKLTDAIWRREKDQVVQ